LFILSGETGSGKYIILHWWQLLHSAEQIFSDKLAEDLGLHKKIALIFLYQPLAHMDSILQQFREVVMLETIEPRIEHSHIQCAGNCFASHSWHNCL
jgi:hypothetical protein